MLPQRTIAKPISSANMSVLEEAEVASGPLTRAKVRQSLKPLEIETSSTTNTPASTTTGRPRSIQTMPTTRHPSRPSSKPSSRTSSLARTTTPGMPTRSEIPIVTDDQRKARRDKQASLHPKSVSQRASQVPKALTSTLPSKTTSLQNPSVKATRPAFSAMQQHYPPSKKSLSVASVDNVKPMTTMEGDYDKFSDLSVELTQLHMLHRTAAGVQRQWEDSAKQSFQHRFDDLCMRHVELKEIAHQQRTLLNQLALVEWCQGIPSAHVAEKVQQVSRNIADIRALLEPDGKYVRVLEIFEAWFARAQQILGLRDKDIVSTQRQDLAFIDGIGDGWKAEAMVLERELTYCLRELKAFGEIRAVSSLSRILSLHKTLVLNLLEELDVIQWIENDIMEHEGLWMEQTINDLSSNVNSNI